MDHVNSHRELPPTSEQDADLVESPHHHIDSHRNCHDSHPSRPPSRLAFNRPVLSTCPADAPADSEAAQWSRSLFQNVGIAELRLSSIKQHSATKMDVTAASESSPPSDDRPEDPILSNEVDASQTGSAEAPGKIETSPAIPRKSPSVSRLCFPFVTTSSPRRKKSTPTPPPTRHKYSCFPSLMSPVPAGRPFPKHPRHSYREHGYSRTALQHVKWFWSIREDTWEGSDARSLHAKAYEGIIEDDIPIPPSQVRPATPTAIQGVSPQQHTNSTSVYPRRGDISALRDPYCAHIDRCFAGLPIWTINKTLWMYDIHMATGLRRKQILSDDEEDSSDDDYDLEISMSTNYSDDSDATLVESESEADGTTDDPPETIDVDAKAQDKLEVPQAGKVGPSSLALSANPTPPKRSNPNSSLVSTNTKVSWSRSMNQNKFAIAQRPRIGEPTKPLWPTNWYRRWELLVDLSRRDVVHHHYRGSLPEISGPPTDVNGNGNIAVSSLTKPSGQYLIAKHHAPDEHSDPSWDARLEIAENQTRLDR